MTELSDFNTFVSGYSIKIFYVAGRFFDLTLEDYIKRACIWYGRHGWRELPDDKYLGKLPNGVETWRYHSVDALALEAAPVMDVTAQHLYDTWLARKARLDKMRNAPDIKIEPPPPEPPKAKPIELPPPVQVPKTPSPGLVRFSVYFGMLASVAGIVTWFIPGAKPAITAVVAIIRAYLKSKGL